MNIQSLTLDYPPRRFIGSELMTHRLNKALAKTHTVRAGTDSLKANPGFEGVEVVRHRWSDPDWADVYVCHADFAGPVIHRNRPTVAVCHNLEAGVLLSVHVNPFALVVCNSDHMRAVLQERDEHTYLVVRPPAPEPVAVPRGERVTIVNLNENKVGRFWDIARARPDVAFLAVVGGYGRQVIPERVPANVELIDSVPHELMGEMVWARTRLLLAPSLRESWNMTAGEAVAHGIPVVSTDLPGVRENLGDAGTFLNRDDLDAWIAALDAPRADVTTVGRRNHARYLSDVDSYVEAVTSLGEHHA